MVVVTSVKTWRDERGCDGVFIVGEAEVGLWDPRGAGNSMARVRDV